jgi:hypothetical protein
LKGVLEVADIIDELKMITHLLQIQRDVLKPMVSALTRLSPSHLPRADVQSNVTMTGIHDSSVWVNITTEGIHSDSIETTRVLAQGIKGGAKDNVISTDETLVTVLAGLDGINKEAEYTHRMVNIAIAPGLHLSNACFSCSICSI